MAGNIHKIFDNFFRFVIFLIIKSTNLQALCNTFIFFADNYIETPWSVIGALRRDLGISVQDLANDKEEDLRSIFSCWWSKELPEDKSIRRILCFEGSYKTGARSTTVIGEIFRCLVSLSKGTEIKVMMPLISTGHQVRFYSQNFFIL